MRQQCGWCLGIGGFGFNKLCAHCRGKGYTNPDTIVEGKPMATSEEHYQAMVRLLQEIEERHVRLEIIRDDAEEPWEVHIEEDGVNESLDIDGGPICISYECGFLPVALGTAWAMFKEAMRREGRKIRLVRD